MTKVVGVRFRQVGKIYFFAPGKYSVETGQHVIAVSYTHLTLPTT